MSVGEFDLINRYFKQAQTLSHDSGVVIGIGDDCAIVDIAPGYQLAVTTDTLVSGVHFFSDVCPYRLGIKALAVNLSDLAAMGAQPTWVSLALTLPNIDEPWLSEFCRGFFSLAKQHNVTLIGGDTTQGPLSITVSAKGLVPHGQALLRSGAKCGDLICVSGALGDGALGLAYKMGELSLNTPQPFIDALELTAPCNTLGMLLSAHANSCIDISDGLTQDLQHILRASNCHAKLDISSLPLSLAMQQALSEQSISQTQAYQYALTGGDDYQLLFTIDAQHYTALKHAQRNSTELNKCVVIGEITERTTGAAIVFTDPAAQDFSLAGWDHFNHK